MVFILAPQHLRTVLFLLLCAVTTHAVALEADDIVTSTPTTFTTPVPSGWLEERTDEVTRFVHTDPEGEILLFAVGAEEEAATLAAVQSHIAPELTQTFVERPLQQLQVPLPSGTWTQRIYRHGDDLVAVISLERGNRTYLVIARGSQAAFMQTINLAVNDVLLGFDVLATPFEDVEQAQPRAGAGEAATLDLASGRLHGTLQLPEGPAPYLVALIIAGSGPTDRDGNSAVIPGKNNSLRLLAEGLASHGVASLRYDKRGVGASAAAGGSEEEVTFDDFVADAVGWLEQLEGDDRFSQMVIIGHSEGSLIGMLAAERVHADAFVSLAGPGQNAADILSAQLAAQLPPPLRDESRIVVQELREGREVPDVNPALLALFRPSVQPYLISWFRYDPAQVLKGLDMPVLLIQGTSDAQVTVAQVERLAAAKPDAEVMILEGMNHVLKRVPAGQLDLTQSYGDPSLPLASGLVETISSFLQTSAVSPSVRSD
jgi:pimeloyl-ACP methyl ester carboxylesterase